MKRRRRIGALTLGLVLLITAAPAATADTHLEDAAAQTGDTVEHNRRGRSADKIIRRAARALGGERRLERLDSFTITAEGVRWTLDEGFTPGEGATMPGPYDLELTYDVEDERFRLDYDLVSFGFVERQITEIVDEDAGYLDGQDNNFAPPGTSAMLTDRWASTRLHQLLMNPHLMVIGLLDGELEADRLPSVKLDGVRHDVLEIEYGGAPISFFVSRRTGLISEVRLMENDPLRRDVEVVVSYSDWRRHRRSVRLPMHVQVHYAGELVQDEYRTATAQNVDPADELFEPPVGVNATFDSFLLARGLVSHQHLQSFAALGFPRDGIQTTVIATELAEGVHLLQGGSHNSLLVEHAAGLTLVDAPLDEYRSEALLDYIDGAFPGALLTEVVQSHHHADHSGGIRTVVAAGAAPAVHESAVGFFTDVFAAASTVVPDALALNPVASDIIAVPSGGSVTIGVGANEVELHSFVQPHSEDLLLVVAGGVAFIVDLYNPAPGVPAPAAAQTIMDTIIDRGLDVDIIAGGHGGFVSFEEFASLLP